MNINSRKLSSFLRFTKLLLPYRSKWIAVIILGISGMLFGLINPYLAKLAIDKAIINKDLRLFIILVLAGTAAFLVAGFINGIKEYLEKYISAKIRFDLSKKLFRHIEYLPLSWSQDNSSGENIYKMNYDSEQISYLLTTLLPEALVSIPKFILTVGIIFWLNWKMAVFSLCLAPILYLPSCCFIKKRIDIWERMVKSREAIYKDLQENFSHSLAIKVFCRESTEIRKYLRKLIISFKTELSNIKWDIFMSFSAGAMDKILVGFIAFYGCYQVINGGLTPGNLTAILVYLAQLMGMQYIFISIFQNTALGFISCQRIAEIMDKKIELIEDKDTRKAGFKNSEIIFKDVSFGYRPQQYIFNNINFTIESGGSRIAVVGSSGCGKTTMLSLMLRLHNLQDGEIFIAGENIRELELKSLRREIGFALQEPLLWNDTVANNIAYGKDNANREEIVKVAQLAAADDFIKSLSAGYDTIIGENACRLSEGQKQKIAIARALIKNPKILILDEAMSSMDSFSEEIILKQIKDLAIPTVIIVSHRLSTVMSCDLVYFLEAPGTMVIDNPRRLLEKDELFCNLFATQLKEL